MVEFRHPSNDLLPTCVSSRAARTAVFDALCAKESMMTRKSNIKDHILSIRVSSDQKDVIRAAMRQKNIMFLSRFARISMVDLAERTLAPIDLSEARLKRELSDKENNLRKALQQVELNIARAPDRIDQSEVDQVIKLIRTLLSDWDKLGRTRLKC